MPDESAPDQATLELAELVIDGLRQIDRQSTSHYSYYLEDPGAVNALATVFVQLNITQFDPNRSVG